MSARDLLLQEEADHLALVVGLDLLAGDDDEVAAPRELDGFERTSEDVVVGDGDPAEPDPLGMVQQVLGRNGAIVRPVRVQMEVDRDPVATRQRSSSVGTARTATLA